MTEQLALTTPSHIDVTSFLRCSCRRRRSLFLASGACTYDDTVYALTVYVTNAEDGSGLEATAVLYPDSEGDKQPGADFNNAYETVKPTPTPAPTPKPTTPKTGDASNPILYTVLIALSVGVIVALFLTRKSKKTEE